VTLFRLWIGNPRAQCFDQPQIKNGSTASGPECSGDLQSHAVHPATAPLNFSSSLLFFRFMSPIFCKAFSNFSKQRSVSHLHLSLLHFPLSALSTATSTRVALCSCHIHYTILVLARRPQTPHQVQDVIVPHGCYCYAMATTSITALSFTSVGCCMYVRTINY
jgi:hypothetical protein